MSLSTGDRLGAYEIRARLGSGGMGVVYRAHDPKLGRDVAIKLLSAKGATDPDRLRRFEQEARAASALDHPNIITIHEIGETDDGQPYLVMQLVEGKSLREIIASKRLSLGDTLGIATQIADGLARAHQHGIVHRDLKPDNVMVNADGLVKILDFGLAKLAEPAIGSELQTVDRDRPQTQEGKIVGTAQYMSPEQAQAESVDARSDIFSFGAILYEMVTGRRAFRGDNAVAVLADIVGRDPERLNAIDPSLPVDLDKIVHRALRKDPDRRLQSAADMKVALNELAEELESGDALTASDVRVVSRTRRRWWMWPAAGVVAAGVVAIVALESANDAAPPRIVPLTSDDDYEFEPAISPDGTQLAYAKAGRIYVKLIGESEAVALTDVTRAASPTWSPDGGHVAFLRHRSPTEHDVLEVPALGGTPRRLGRSDAQGHGLSYSPDGKQLAIVHRESPREPGAIFLLSRDSGAYRRLTTPPPDIFGDRLPRFSPDGRRIVFERVERGPLTPRLGDVMVYDLVEDEELVLVTEQGWLNGADWTPDGERIVYSAGLSWDAMHLESIAIDGGAPKALVPGERAVRPSLARRANRLVYVKEVDDWNIWRIGGPAASERAPAERIVASTWYDTTPDPSPDGTRLAFTSGRSGAWQIWISDADGSSPRPLTTNSTAPGWPRWSPDGNRITFHALDSSRVGQVHLIDAGGGFSRQVTEEALTSLYPSWSRDGRHIFFDSVRGDASDIRRVSLDEGRSERVLQNASMASPLEDGDLLFARNGSVWSLSNDDAEPEKLIDINRFRWAPWRNTIVYLTRSPNGFFVDVLDRDSGSSTRLDEIPSRGDVNRPVVTADGQWIYYHQRDTSGADIMLVENFTADP